MPIDTATYIAAEVKAILVLLSEIDPYYPEEDMVEVLIGTMTVWGTIEAELLFLALEAAFEGSEAVTEPARQRLNTLYALQTAIHEGEAAEDPFNEAARKYIDGVKYHLAADIQNIVPLAAQLPYRLSRELAGSMAAMKQDLE